jgi:hypothetical protein
VAAVLAADFLAVAEVLAAVVQAVAGNANIDEEIICLILEFFFENL